MSEHANATFEVDRWDEQPYNEVDGAAKLTRARVSKTFRGDLEGTGTVEYLMMYRDGGSASFVGLERVVGRLAGRSGSFVLQHTGIFENGTANVVCHVVPGSGRGNLRNLRGECSFAARTRSVPFTLHYDIE
jgi:hypothetical protein